MKKTSNLKDKWGITNMSNKELVKFANETYGDWVDEPVTYKNGKFHTSDEYDKYHWSREELVYNLIEFLKEHKGEQYGQDIQS